MKKGFTLVEVMIVIAIIGILTAIVVPNIRREKEKQHSSKKSTLVERVTDALTTPPANRFAFDGHTYIQFGALNSQSIVHDPDCMRCRK